MRRLIQAEIFKGYTGLSGTYYECFENPTTREWDILFKEDNWIRCILCENGSIYAWVGSITHSNAIGYFDIPDGIHILLEKNLITFYLTPKINLECLINSVKKCTYMDCFLNYKIDEINTRVYHAKDDPKYEEFINKPFSYIKNYDLMIVKSIRLIKAEFVQEFPIENLKNRRGQIGDQGVDSENIRKILNNLGMNFAEGTNIQTMVETLKLDQNAISQLQQLCQSEPISVQKLPDDLYAINDGHHRAFLMDQLGFKTIPANIN